MAKWRPEKRKAPCAECPFRRTSVRGYLGADNPEHFVQTAAGGSDLPCHMDIDYTDPDWLKTQEPDAPLCVGSLQFQNNWLSLSRLPHVAEAQRELEGNPRVFDNPEEFLIHHKYGRWDGPTEPGQGYRAAHVDVVRGVSPIARVESWRTDEESDDTLFIAWNEDEEVLFVAEHLRDSEELSRWWDGHGDIRFRHDISQSDFDAMRERLSGE